MKATASLLLLSVLFFCCSQKETSGVISREVTAGVVEETAEKGSRDSENPVNYEIVNAIRYEVNCLSAIDFLNKTGRVVQPSDADELQQEMVVLFTMSDTSAHKQIRESEQMVFSDEELNGYLQYGILSDFTILQNGKVFFPTGVQSDNGGVLHQNKISTLLFFDSINMKQKFTIQYNDQLFGAGLLRVNFKKLML